MTDHTHYTYYLNRAVHTSAYVAAIKSEPICTVTKWEKLTDSEEYTTCPLCLEILKTKSNWQESNDTAEEIAALRAHADGY